MEVEHSMAYEAVGFACDGQPLSKAIPKAGIAAPSEFAATSED